MWKSALAAMAALAIAGSTLTYGQDRMPDPAGPAHPALSPEDESAFLDARIAALKAGLELTPAQEPNWPAYEQAVRNLAKLRSERKEAEGAQAMPTDLIERLQRHADALTKRAAAVKQLADAAAPLYGSLDEAQKRRFLILAHHLRAHGEHHHGMGMGGIGFEHPHEFGSPHEGRGWHHEPAQ